jgi:primosomal protein N''
MSYPASLKVGPLETVHEDGSKSVQRLADKMYAEQENINREIHAIKTKMGFKRDDLAYAEYYKSGASGKKQERKLSDFEEDYERKLSKFKENNKIGFKEAVIC